MIEARIDEPHLSSEEARTYDEAIRGLGYLAKASALPYRDSFTTGAIELVSMVWGVGRDKVQSDFARLAQRNPADDTEVGD